MNLMMPLAPPLSPFPAVPVGSVVAFAGNLDPSDDQANAVRMRVESSGWLVCDGDKYRVAEYPELFAIIGYLYVLASDNMPPSSDTDEAWFRVPNLEGQFLRGTTQDTKLDPDLGIRTTADGKTSSEVGSFQPYALQDHVHSYSDVGQTNADPSGKEVAGTTPETEQTSDPLKSPSTPTDVDLGLSTSETRPQNVSVYFLIRYTSLSAADGRWVGGGPTP